MFSFIKAVRIGLVASSVALSAVGPAFAQDAKIGNGATINLQGQIGKQVALAFGERSTAHNVVGGITAGGGLSIGSNASVTARGKADSQWAGAGGLLSSASNNVGGILVTGGLTSR